MLNTVFPHQERQYIEMKLWHQFRIAFMLHADHVTSHVTILYN